MPSTAQPIGSVALHEAWAVGTYNIDAQEDTAKEAMLVVQASVALGPTW